MVTNTFTNGTTADADEVNQNFIDVETKLYADNTAGNTTSTSETDLATITVLQNDLNNNASLVINAGFAANKAAISGIVFSLFKLYVNGVEVDSYSVEFNGGSGEIEEMTGGSAFVHMATGIDSTAGDVIVKVTAQNTGAENATMTVTGLTVVGYNR